LGTNRERPEARTSSGSGVDEWNDARLEREVRVEQARHGDPDAPVVERGEEPRNAAGRVDVGNRC